MRIWKYAIGWAALILAVLAVWMFGGGEDMEAQTVQPSPTAAPSPVSLPREDELYPQEASDMKELRGVWVPYMALNTAEHTQEAFKANFRAIADSAYEKGLNALFVHVRAFSDALYPSELYPWSHILTGEQGKDPGFDPLEFMVEYTHGLGMKFHAWINPLRVSTAETPANMAGPLKSLREEAPYYFMEWEGGAYLDPAYPYVRSLIAKGAGEIVEKYPVDGIHFDDYFYPSEDPSLDMESYELYAGGVSQPLGLLEWRTANISAMMAEVYEQVKAAGAAAGRDAVFGVSPQGNMDNDANMGADVAAWCATPGYIDYICPQLYYGFENPALSYTKALLQWRELYRHEGLELYAGLALYKAGDPAQGEDWTGGDVISRQIEAARAAECSGVILYSSAYLEGEQTREEVRRAVETLAGVG